MAQRRLNKKLVAGLTIAGMAITTAAAIVMVMALPQRDPGPALQQAEQAEEAGDYQRARDWYMRAHRRASAGNKNTPESNDYLVRAGSMALAMGDARGALGAWQKVTTNDPSHEGAQQKIVDFMLELSEIGSVKWANVETEANKLLKINPNSFFAMHALGLSLVNQRAVNEENLAKGQAQLVKAFEGDKSNSEFADTLASHYFQEGQVEKGVEVFDELMNNLSKDPAEQAAAWRKRGLFFLKRTAVDQKTFLQKQQQRTSASELQKLETQLKQEDAEANQCLAKAREIDPENVETLMALGQYWAIKGSIATQKDEQTKESKTNFAKAEDFYKQAIHLEPDGYEAYLQLARLHMANQDLDNASQVLYARQQRGIQREGYLGGRNKWSMARIRNEIFRISMLQADLLRQQSDTKESPASQELIARLENLYKDQAADFGDDNPSVLFMKGRLLILKKDVIGAIKAFEQASRLLASPDPQMSQYLAQLYIQTGEYGPAAKALRTVLQAYPSNAAAWATQATLMAQINQNEAALQAAERALQLAPGNRQALMAMARVYESQKNWDKVREIQQTLNTQQANSTTDKLQRAAIYRVQAGSETENSDALLKKAEDLLREALRDDPLNSLALRQMAVLLGRDEAKLQTFLTEQISVAKAKLKETASATQPSEQDKTKYENALQALQRLQTLADPAASREDKLKHLEESIKQDEDPFVVAAGLYKLYAGQPDREDDALAQLKKAHELKPDQTNIVDLLFKKALSMEDWDLAQEMAEKAIKLGLDRSGGHFYRGQLMAARTDVENNNEKAVAEYRAGLREFPTYSAGHLLLGRVLARLERYDEAKQAFEESIRLNPRNAMAALGLATLADQRNDKEEKVKYLNICAKIIPTHPWVEAELQAIQDERDPAAGIARREQIRKDKPKDVNNLIRLAGLYADQEDNDKAKTVYEAALKESPLNLAVIERYTRFLRSKQPPEPSAASDIIEKVIEQLADSKPLHRATAQLLLATHLETVLEQKLPDAPSRETVDTAYEKAAEMADDPAVRLDIGNYYYENGQLDKAEQWFRQALAKADESDLANDARKARKLIIDTLIRTRDPKREEDLQKEIQAFQERYDDPFVLLASSEYHTNAGRLGLAIEAINLFIQQQPNNATGLLKRADINFQRSLWQQALNDYRVVKSLEPDGFGYEPRVRLALCLERMKDNDLAIAELLSILNAEPRQNSALNELMRIYRKLGHWSAMEQLLTQREKDDPDNPQWTFMLLDAYTTGKNATKAIQQAEKIIQQSKGADNAIQALLRTYLAFGKHDDLIRFVKSRISPDKQKTAWVSIPLAAAYAAKGDNTQAMQLYNRALDELSGHPQLFVKAVTEMKQPLGPQATLPLLRRRLAKNPEEKGSIYAIGMVEKESGNKDAFVDALEKLLASQSDDSTQDKSDRLFLLRSLGVERQIRGEYEKARTAYEEMLKIDPYNIVALNNLAFLLMEKFDDPDSAIAYSSTAMNLLPKNASVLDTGGWNLILLGHLEPGIAALRRAIGLDDGLAAIHYHVAEGLFRHAEQSEATRQMDLREAAAECRRAHELLRAAQQDEEGIFDKVIELGKKLGLDLDPRLKTN